MGFIWNKFAWGLLERASFASVERDAHVLGRDRCKVPDIDTACLQTSFCMCRNELWNEIWADGQLFSCKVKEDRHLLSILHLCIRLTQLVEQLQTSRSAMGGQA